MVECSRAYADATGYAIERGVDVITSSAAPWPNTPEVHAAIDRAVEASVVFVGFHYNGHNDAVIRDAVIRDAVIRPSYSWDAGWEVGALDLSIADAAAAIENCPSGRQLVGQDDDPAPGGRCRVSYQAPSADSPGLDRQVQAPTGDLAIPWERFRAC